MRSMLALQPVWEVTTAHGEEPRRRETTTDSTFAPSTSVAQVQPPLGDVDELLLLEIRQVGHRDLVDGLGEEQHLETLLEQALREGGGLGGVLGGGGQEEDPLLALLHAGDIVRQGRLLLAVRRGKAEELGQSFAVGGVLDHPELEVPPEGLPEGVQDVWSSRPESCFSVSSVRFTSCFRTMRVTRDSWRISRLTFRGRSDESTTPFTKLRYRGIRLSSNSSEMNTRLT